MLSVALLAAPQFGYAAGTDNTDHIHTNMTVPLYVDCSRVPNTKEAQKFLAEHNLCGYGRGEQTDGVTPQDTATGDCGSLSLNLFNDRAAGVMLWKAEITSSIVPMVQAWYNGKWENQDNGRSGAVNRSSYPFWSSWVDPIPITTGAGWVWGTISVAESTNWYGVICRNTRPVATSTKVS